MNDWKPKMEKTVRRLAEQLQGIRPGTLSIGFVETFRVALGAQSVPLSRLAAVSNQGDRIAIRPFDPSNVPAVTRALTEARLNAYAGDPRTVLVSVPPPSGEQQAEIARHVKAIGEEAKVAVRMIRQDARKQIAARGRGSERAVQEATDSAIAEIERRVREKLAGLALR
jgi:ribosome recycling factor